MCKLAKEEHAKTTDLEMDLNGVDRGTTIGEAKTTSVISKPSLYLDTIRS